MRSVMVFCLCLLLMTQGIGSTWATGTGTSDSPRVYEPQIELEESPVQPEPEATSKPWYKKWWIWALAGLAIGGGVTAGIVAGGGDDGGGNGGGTQTTDIEVVIPAP